MVGSEPLSRWPRAALAWAVLAVLASVAAGVEAAAMWAARDVALGSSEVAAQAAVNLGLSAVPAAVWWSVRRFRRDRATGPVVLWAVLAVAVGVSQIVAVNFL